MKRQKVYPERKFLHERFEYIDGKLFWKKRPLDHFQSSRSCKAWNTRFAGVEAADALKCGRGRVTLNYICYMRSIIIWIMFNGDYDNNIYCVDHKNRCVWDDRIDNLRLGTVSQIAQNVEIRRTNSVDSKNVHYDRKRRKYRVRVGFDSKRVSVGYYDTLEEATEASKIAMKEYHGDFARYT